jgi:Phage integrase family
MALFAVNTGLRDSNLCGLQWKWEAFVPEIGRSVFIVPAEAFKSKRPHVVILNDAAWSIVQSQRGQHPIWVFPYRGKPVQTMNNTSWQSARRALGLSRFASMTCDIPLGLDCARPVCPTKIGRRCSGMHAMRCRRSMRVRTSAVLRPWLTAF